MFLFRYLVLPLIAFFLVSCATNLPTSNSGDIREIFTQWTSSNEAYMLETVEAKMNGEAGLDRHFDIVVEEEAPYIGAFSRVGDETKIYLTRGMVNAVKSGKMSKDTLLMIMGHEIGHFYAHKLPPERYNRDEEQFCDYTGLLMLEEMQSEGWPIDLYRAISFFLEIPNHPTDEEYYSPQTRYQRLKDKIDYWKRTEHRAPEA